MTLHSGMLTDLDGYGTVQPATMQKPCTGRFAQELYLYDSRPRVTAGRWHGVGALTDVWNTRSRGGGPLRCQCGIVLDLAGGRA